MVDDPNVNITVVREKASKEHTETKFYQIYEFSQYNRPGEGFGLGGDRLSNGRTWEQVPPPLKQAKAALEGQIPQTAIRPDPCVFGQILAGTDPQGHSRYWALVTVAHRIQDDANRSFSAFRYFWCDIDQQRPEGLQAILCWFERLGLIPQWDPDDTLHQQPLETYQIPVETVSASLPKTPPPPLDTYLLLPDFAQDQSPIPALQHLNQTVIATLETRNLDLTYLAWAWNISDLTRPQGFFIKPIDAAAYYKLLPRVSPLAQPDPPDPAPPGNTTPSPLPTPGTPTPPDLTAAITAVAQAYSCDLKHSTNLERLSQALKSLEAGLADLDLKDRTRALSKAFEQADCNRPLWERASQPEGLGESLLGLLFLQALLLPTLEIPGISATLPQATNCFTALLSLLQSPPKGSLLWLSFQKFSRALRKTLWPPTAPDTYKAFPGLHAALIDMGRWFFGALYLVERHKPNSKTSQSYTKLLKDLFKAHSLWPFCLNYALDQMLQRLEEPEPPQTWDSTSPGWQQFESDLHLHLRAYQKAWTEHRSYYQPYIQTYPDHKDHYENQRLQTWPQTAVKLREQWRWKPLLENAGLLAAFEQQHKHDAAAASKLRVVVDHLDQGCTTLTTWPPDQRLPGGLVFVPETQGSNRGWPQPVSAIGNTLEGINTQFKRIASSSPAPSRSSGTSTPTQTARQPSSHNPSLTSPTQPQTASSPPAPVVPSDPITPNPTPEEATPNPARSKWWPRNRKEVILWVLASLAVLGANRPWVWWGQRHTGSDPALAKTVIQDINRLAKFQSAVDRATVTTPGKPTIMTPAELSVALSETLRTPGVITASSEALLDQNPKPLTQALGSYQQRMGLTDPVKTAQSLLCLTLDRRIREPGNFAQPLATTPDRRALTPETLVREISVCTDRLLFVERQMDIADQRFWFGDILVWTQQRAKDGGIMDAREQLFAFLNELNQKQNISVDLPQAFNPQKPLEQRALLESFYAYALTDTDFSSPLGTSEGLINLGSQLPTGGVGTLKTTQAFLCTFSETQMLGLPDCAPQTATGGNPQNSPSPSSAPNDPLADLPPDVQSFVQRWAAQQGIPEAEVLEGLKVVLGIPLTGAVAATTWEDGIRDFQTNMKETNPTGRIVENGTTEANLARRLFSSL